MSKLVTDHSTVRWGSFAGIKGRHYYQVHQRLLVTSTCKFPARTIACSAKNYATYPSISKSQCPQALPRSGMIPVNFSVRQDVRDFSMNWVHVLVRVGKLPFCGG